MSKRRRFMSTAIEALPELFDMSGIVRAATELLRSQSPMSSSPRAAGATHAQTIDAGQIERFMAANLLDPVAAEIAPFRRRHLLQIVAIINLRGLSLSDDRIRTLVQGVDDGHLRMLCDEPAEAEKKAAVMTNWLKMLTNGKVGRPERGETHMLHAPTSAAPASDKLAVAPRLDLHTPAIAPPGGPVYDNLPAVDATVPLGRSRPVNLPSHAPLVPLAGDDKRPPRATRPTFAATHALSNALRDQIDNAALTPPLGARNHVGNAQTDVATALAPHHPQEWLRVRLADGVELHVRTGRKALTTTAMEEALRAAKAVLER